MNPSAPLYSCTLLTVIPDPTSIGTFTELFTSIIHNDAFNII